LSGQTSTVVAVDLPGFGGEVEFTRGELANIIASPLDGVLDTITDTLARNSVPAANLVAVATVGGGAAISAVGTRLAERLRVPVITAPQPGFTAATGAMLLAGRHPPSGSTAAAGTPEAPTSMTRAAWAAGAA